MDAYHYRQQIVQINWYGSRGGSRRFSGGFVTPQNEATRLKRQTGVDTELLYSHVKQHTSNNGSSFTLHVLKKIELQYNEKIHQICSV